MRFPGTLGDDPHLFPLVPLFSLPLVLLFFPALGVKLYMIRGAKDMETCPPCRHPRSLLLMSACRNTGFKTFPAPSEGTRGHIWSD